MSLPDVDPAPLDRRELPIVPFVGDDSPAWHVMRDLGHLARQGLIDQRFTQQVMPDGTMIPQPAEDAFLEGWRMLDELGLHGAYEQHVRDHGVIEVCPAWCTSDHPRAVIVDPSNPTGQVFHEVFLADLGTLGRCEVGAFSEDHGHVAPRLTLLDTVEDLDPPAARTLAHALLRAADALEAVTTNTPHAGQP